MSFISESKVSNRAPESKENELLSTNFQISPPEIEYFKQYFCEANLCLMGQPDFVTQHSTCTPQRTHKKWQCGGGIVQLCHSTYKYFLPADLEL